MASDGLSQGYTASRCLNDSNVREGYEEVCVIDAHRPDRTGAFTSGEWVRETPAFVPTIVQGLARREDIALATHFSNRSISVYADANLSRAIVYRRSDVCREG